jgi:hypothetical protein
MRTPANNSAPLEATSPSSSGAQPLTEKNQLVSTIKGILKSYHDKLIHLNKKSHKTVADKLYASGLISEDVKNDPSMEDFITDLEDCLSMSRDVSELQSNCSKFLQAFIDTGGPYKAIADILHEDIIKTITHDLNCNFKLDI